MVQVVRSEEVKYQKKLDMHPILHGIEEVTLEIVENQEEILNYESKVPLEVYISIK